MLAASHDDRQSVPRFFVERMATPQKLDESEDRVERRPQLVAHARQKQALRFAGHLRRLTGLIRQTLGLTELRHGLRQFLRSLRDAAFEVLVERIEIAIDPAESI